MGDTILNDGAATGTPPQDALIAQAQSMFEHYLKCGYLPHMSAREATEWIAASRASGTAPDVGTCAYSAIPHRQGEGQNIAGTHHNTRGEVIPCHKWRAASGTEGSEALVEVGVNILHWLDHLDQTSFLASGLRDQLRYALADCGVSPERISPTGEQHD